MITKDTVEIVEELRKILGSIKGVKILQERLSLSYLALVESEEHKESVRKVSDALIKQASQYNFDLDVLALTEEDLQNLQNGKEEEKEAPNFSFESKKF